MGRSAMSLALRTYVPQVKAWGRFMYRDHT
jgi:hypothetical protein